MDVFHSRPPVSPDGADEEPDALGPGQLGIWSAGMARWLHRSTIEQPAR